MILRVYAMYNRSRTILGVLLVIYIAEVCVFIGASIIYSDPKYGTGTCVSNKVDHSFTKFCLAVSITQLIYIAVCNVVPTIQRWTIAPTVVKLAPSTVMCILVAAQFVRDSLQMYQATRTWQLNRYMNLLVRDGFLYFLVYVPLFFLRT